MRRAVENLADLAEVKGFRVERGLAHGTYRLIDKQSGKPLFNVRRSTSFSVVDALRVLRRLPDRR